MAFRRILIYGVGLLTSAAALQGCNYSNMKGSPGDTSGTVDAQSLGFDKLNQEIFTPYCVRCHSSQSAAGGVSLDNYTSVFQSLNRVRDEIHTGAMPPASDGGPLPLNLQDMLEAWVEVGAPEKATAPSQPPSDPGTQPAPAPNPPPAATPVPTPTPAPAPNPAPTPVVSVPTFATISSRIISPRCVSCHGSSINSASGLLKKGWVVAGKASSSPIYTRITRTGSGRMPPSGSAIPAADAQLLQQWINNGAKD